MREFLLTVTYNNLNTKQELNFIVGESTTPPTWNSVKANPTKITRAFNNGNLKTRRIYFSATEQLTDVSFDGDGNATITGKVIDLSQDGQTEAQITKEQAPGIMTPSTDYYVYVYDSRGALVKQQKVTTAGYPTDPSSFIEQVGAAGGRTSGASFDEYFWGMDAWQDANGVYQIVKDVEVKKGEVFFLPLRMRSPIDWDLGITNSYCTTTSSKEIRFRLIIQGQTTLFTIKPSGIDNLENLFSFSDSLALFPNLLSASEKDETFDLMYLAEIPTNSSMYYDTFQPCLDLIGGSPLLGFTQESFTEIEE